jgi:hypothetical protein
MFHKLVWNIVLILSIQNTTNYYIYYTNYYKLTTITMYFWIYLHPEVIIIAAIRVGAHAARWRLEATWLRLRRGGVIAKEEVLAVLGHQLLFRGVELVHRRFLRGDLLLHLLLRVTRGVIAAIIIGEPQPLPHYRGLGLLLHLVLVVVVVEGYCWRRESVEMERVISWMRESDRPLHFI